VRGPHFLRLDNDVSALDAKYSDQMRRLDVMGLAVASGSLECGDSSLL
jgi:hypothetical protein